MESILQLLELGGKMCSLTLALLLTFIYCSCGGRELKLSVLGDEQRLQNCRSLAAISIMLYMNAAVVDPPT